MISKQERDEQNDQQKNKKAYWILIGVGVFVFLIIARWAMVNVSNRMMQMREAFWPLFKKVALIVFIFAIVFAVIIVLLNYFAKKQEWDDNNDQ